MTQHSTMTPHFFKIFLESVLPGNKLLLPNKFVRKYGDTLLNPVSVKLPCGSEWEMELRKFDGKVWLGKGWPEFAGNYSIGNGNLLLFKYQGNSRFHVFIFDKSTIEIDYPLIPSYFDEPQRVEIADDDSIEILEDISTGSRKRKNSPLPCSRPQKNLQTSPIGKTEINFSHCGTNERIGDQSNEKILESSMRNRDSQCSKSKMKGKLHILAEDGDEERLSTPRQTKCEVARRMQQTPANDEVKAPQRESCFESESLTCQIFLKPYNVIKYYDLTFPLHFSKNILEDKSCYVTLKLSNGGTWPIKIGNRTYNHKHVRARFHKLGWKKFVEDNCLKVGDVCIFKQIHGNKTSLEVSIVRSADDVHIHTCHAGEKVPNPSKPKDQIAEKEIRGFSGCSGALEAARRFYSTNPFFQRTVEASHLKHCCQKVPADFVKKYIGQKAQTVTLKVGRKSWSVMVLVHLPYTYTFSGGWPTFARENSLSQGDVCVYELIKDKIPIVFKVSIFKVNEY